MRLGARIQRENYLKKKILADVEEGEARDWYEEHQEDFGGASFDEAKESIIDALTTYQRDEGWKLFRRHLLRERAKGDKVNKAKIQIFEENLEEDASR